ncbi:MAG: EAL domain-containing protein [Sulfuricurvum sp.]|uniref:bifunctional diguanylate cyclase/phosphodiesterase n=1 Tax=Sulfuricurvum sp. TaxID=2025608 RepID=UPI002636D35B|nr:EAL domain-containing protein [Sulfuricurvum sp.]MDD2829645.1 EAL domain-containing protein [Sulfuricurvum sp.]MDD4948687.1 EAL domain-containing protein [Sulfuricurvum sp.]
MQQKRTSFVRQLWYSVFVLILFIITFNIYVYSEKQIDRENEVRLMSFILADELRHSSDDLTRMVRTYIATGNPIYKNHYQEILDIRDGRKLRPINYQSIYWDLVGLDNIRPTPYSNQSIPLIEMMKLAHFTPNEFSKLSEAKKNSDDLTHTEFTAMKMIESNSTLIDKNIQQNKALKILHDEHYHNAKASIMKPIEQFYIMMENRTNNAVHTAEKRALYMRFMLIFIGLYLIFMLWRLGQTLQTILGGTVDDLHGHIRRIGQGDFSIPIVVDSTKKESLIDWLAQTQSTLKELIFNNERLKNLYAALSQCNQAIVRASSQEELFPIICRDAIQFGGMKMAWIGMIDEASQSLRAVNYYGDGTDYLNDLIISTDPNDPSSHGPTGSAFLQNKPFWCQDFLHSPITEQWHERGKRYGWGASAALPLRRNGNVVGVFTLYAQEVNAFDEAAQKLLEEMAMDISYALESYEHNFERKKMEVALRKSQEHLSSIIENEPECVKLVNANGQLIEMNPAGLAMLEADSLEEAQRHTLIDYILPQWRAPFTDLHKKVMNGENDILEFEIQGLKGTRRWLETHATPLRDSEGNVTMLLGITRDTTERKHNEERISYLASFDTLTGLPNRNYLNDYLLSILSLAKRHETSFTVIFLDIDHFKDINDTLGHHIGDLLLIESASRLKSVLREEDMVSRLGGDEFIILLPKIEMYGAERVAKKLLDIMKNPFYINSHELSLTTSIGIALYPNDGEDFESLYKNADTAMYRVKQDGRNGYCFFTEDMQRNSIRNLELSNALHHALSENQFTLHYQPQISAKTEKIIGAEALLRWNHPQLGAISPTEFIPIAEDNGLIIPIGEWVLRTALQQAKKWMDQGEEPIIMAVNLSAVQFKHIHLVDMVSSILDEISIPAEYLELELTESTAMHDPQHAINIIHDLHSRGVRMSIDDFGTGYSSLNYLKKFKIYKLKIDQSFIRDINTDHEDKAIVSAIINMAKALGLQTIAEGVETIGQLDYLKAEGCDEIQGYFYSKPLDIKGFEAFRKDNNIIVPIGNEGIL